MKNKIKTIDIQAKEWFDKVNGNSYFSAIVTTDYGTKKEQTFKIPFEYGHNTQYQQEGLKALLHAGLITTVSKYELKEQGIILRSNIQTGCKKADVKNYTL